MTTQQLMAAVKAAAPCLAACSAQQKNRALTAMADSLAANTETILRQNRADLDAAKGAVSEVMLDRLALDEARIAAMADGIRQVAALPDPVGRVLQTVTRPNGLKIKKVSVPLGVVAIIYESRPNVTSDAAALCIKSGNACLLRSGKEAHRSATAIVEVLRQGLQLAGLSPNLIGLVQDTSRRSAADLMNGVGLIDLLIPRGGKGLIQACVENAKVPCIETGTGVCHIYVDQSADFAMALAIIDNAKTSRPSVCNAAEQLLVHRSIAAQFLPLLQQRLGGRVELRTDAAAAAILGTPTAAPQDFETEFLDYILGVQVVDSLQSAVQTIAAHSTHHSDCILTQDDAAAAAFIAAVDSAAVYVNASTRFTDGGEFGLGCEMGISTQKLHARGPMGLQELTTYQYIIYGNGQVR